MKHLRKSLLLNLLFVSFTLCASQQSDIDLLSDNELALIEQHPSVVFAYIPEPVRDSLLCAIKECESEFSNAFWVDVKNDARIVSYEDLMQEIPKLNEYFNRTVFHNDVEFQRAKNLFEVYKSWIENGEAVITTDDIDITRSRCKVIHRLLVKCKLIAGCLQVCGNICFGGELIGPDGPIAPLTPEERNYLFSYSTATQTISVANTFQTATFSTVGISNGWSTAGPAGSFTGFTPTTSSVYQVTYTASAERVGGPTGQRIVEARALLDGSPIAGSQMHIDISSNNESSIISNSFQVAVTAGSIIGFQIASAQTNTQISGESLAGSSVNPSITVTIAQVK